MDNCTVDFINIIMQLIQNATDNQDQTVFCSIESVNTDGSLNIYIVPDFTNRVTNIKNASKYEFKQGDTAILFKIRNNIANSFVIAKVGNDNLIKNF